MFSIFLFTILWSTEKGFLNPRGSAQHWTLPWGTSSTPVPMLVKTHCTPAEVSGLSAAPSAHRVSESVRIRILPTPVGRWREKWWLLANFGGERGRPWFSPRLKKVGDATKETVGPIYNMALDLCSVLICLRQRIAVSSAKLFLHARRLINNYGVISA